MTEKRQRGISMGDGESIEVFVCYKIISVAAFGSAIRLRAKTLLNRIRILPNPNLTFFNNQSVVSKYRFSSLSDNKLSAHTYGRICNPAQKWIRISVRILNYFHFKNGLIH